ncbi:ABC-type nickel/cobalt efflux system permease component RcnA [Silvimonas terrae]|uniref:Nickel/cobalt efflux system n=1 Tax=Silvimonas terrae TaxID=300266 RepID=A0A840RJV8_9NEIS|nr:ABC transporter [Silvimonas terrae]MBB5192586.1 ABC-type nickel/cobalt efflux system permease component RcnA [Silvimonas terrae]
MSLLASPRWFIALLLALVAIAVAQPAMAVDYFGRAVVQTASAPAASAVAPTATAQPALSTLPAPVRAVIGQLVVWQSKLNAVLREALQQSRQNGSSTALWLIVLVSFVYGVLHAAGPGHGKVVIGSYFLTQRARVLHGVALSAWAATVQALCAIVLVGGLAALLGNSSLSILNHAATLETVSYAILGGMGVLMLWRLARGLDTCGCEPDQAQAPKAGAMHAPLRRKTAGKGTGKITYRAAGSDRAARNWRQMALAGAAVGLRPCTGAILVLIFCLANGIFLTGVLSTFAMAAGVAITVSLISLGAMGVNRLTPAHGRRSGWQRGLSWAGAGAIALFGVLQTVLLITGIISPTLG